MRKILYLDCTLKKSTKLRQNFLFCKLCPFALNWMFGSRADVSLASKLQVVRTVGCVVAFTREVNQGLWLLQSHGKGGSNLELEGLVPACAFQLLYSCSLGSKGLERCEQGAAKETWFGGLGACKGPRVLPRLLLLVALPSVCSSLSLCFSSAGSCFWHLCIQAASGNGWLLLWGG